MASFDKQNPRYHAARTEPAAENPASAVSGCPKARQDPAASRIEEPLYMEPEERVRSQATPSGINGFNGLFFW
jgi:hypothetical protein